MMPYKSTTLVGMHAKEKTTEKTLYGLLSISALQNNAIKFQMVLSIGKVHKTLIGKNLKKYHLEKDDYLFAHVETF
jgi:hypothetical protein